jgi:uncharacterized protein (TIGR01777 family)
MTPTGLPSARAELRILISGATGFIGTELVRQLEADGHTVIRLVRAKPRQATDLQWSPSKGVLDGAVMETVDAVINLSGASTGRLPWTRAYRREILQSRLLATTALATAINAATHPPTVLLSGSAVGYYGDRPGELLTEKSAAGSGYFPDVVRAWESAALLIPQATRVVTFRTGVVVGRGGAFTPLLALTRFGLGSRFGSGTQNWPWISLRDEAAAIRHLLTSTLSGPVNLAGPTPATSGQMTAYLAKRMRRPYLFRIPAAIIRGLLGDAGRELLLTNENVSSDLLAGDGFEFEHPTVEAAIDAMLAASSR